MDEHDALPAGTRFGELEILRVVGVGGFGIVYLARDHSLDRDVALKEYMPGQLAARGPSAQVSVRSGSHMETFALGLRSFVNEARLLARFDHRSLVKVYRFWEANNTAYMVMPFLQGRTLREVRRAMVGPPDEAWLRHTLNPLFEALEILHREAVYHRDIAPDNILLPHDGSQGVLLDFGAARRAIGDRTQTFTAILKPSYAPIEQYAESVSLRQGPWTDIYAMGAVIHYLLKGVPPPPATARTFEDHSEVLAELNIPGVSRTFLAAVDWALAVRPQDRPQSVSEFREALDGRLVPPVVARKPAAAPPPSDAFVKTAADPTRPAVHELQSAPMTGAEPTVIARPPAAAATLMGAAAKGMAPLSTETLSAGGIGGGIAPPAAVPVPVPGPRPLAPQRPGPVAPEARAAQKSPQGPSEASAIGRFWPWALPVLLFAVAASAWWWSARQGGRSDATVAASPAATEAASAAVPVKQQQPAVLAPPVPVANPPAAKEAATAVVAPTPAAVPDVSPTPTPAPAAPAQPAATVTAAAKNPAPTAAGSRSAGRNDNRNDSRNDGRNDSRNDGTTSASTTSNSGAAPRIVLEPRQPRPLPGQETARAGATETGAGSSQRVVIPMWPPAPPSTEEQRPKPNAAPRAAEAPPPDSPHQICGPRSFLIRLACMDRECRSARFASHPQCADIRARDEMRQQGNNNYGGNR
jgi:hypothetical protein